MYTDLPDRWFLILALSHCWMAVVDDPTLLDARVEALEVV